MPQISHSIRAVNSCGQLKDQMSASIKSLKIIWYLSMAGLRHTLFAWSGRRAEQKLLRMRCACAAQVFQILNLRLRCQVFRFRQADCSVTRQVERAIPKHGKQKMSFFACLVISVKPQGEMEILARANAATVVAALLVQESRSHLVHRARLDAANCQHFKLPQ